MPKVNTTPKNLRPYIFHGVDLTWSDDGDNATGECTWCGRDGKFSVETATGLWRCFVCAEGTDKGGGNAHTFIRMLWERSQDYGEITCPDDLAKDRGLLPNSLKAWGVCQSALTHDWLVPGFGADGKLNQLYRYLDDSATGKRKLLPTPELHHQIHGANLYDPNRKTVYIAEGPWDGMALWEMLRAVKVTDEGLTVTGSEAASLLGDANVVAIPGCGSVGSPFEKWLPLFAGKRVVMMFDSDHPREHPQGSGRYTQAGMDAAKRCAEILARAEEPPEEILWVKWGENGYDPDQKSGYDVRDVLSVGDSVATRIPLLGGLLDKIEPIPETWIAGRSRAAASKGGTEIDCKHCDRWEDLILSWRKAMKWTEGLDRALSVMLACVTSTKAIGDQLWVKVIGPPACGKSTLCEAISVNKKYIMAKSTIRGFHSGYKDKESGENVSLILKLADKTLITKDGDTLLQAPNRDQILSEARDLYDTTSRSDYRNGMGMDHEGIRTTWILCGTSALRQIDQSELGARFIDVVIMESIDEDLEDEILWRVVNRADRGMAIESDGVMETQNDPDMVKAMQLTGGYVGYLRSNARDLLASVLMSDEAKVKCMRLGKFVAYMRARPSKKQEETQEREFASRLVSQFTRLAKCMAVVLNRRSTDEEVMRRVKAVALDTARGRTLELVRHLYGVQEDGASVGQLAIWTNQTDDKERELLRFLKKLGATEFFHMKGKIGLGSKPVWKLSPRLVRLYKEVHSDA